MDAAEALNSEGSPIECYGNLYTYGGFVYELIQNAAEIAQFNGDIVGQTIGDFIECALDHIKDFMLDHSGLVADGDNDVALG